MRHLPVPNRIGPPPPRSNFQIDRLDSSCPSHCQPPAPLANPYLPLRSPLPQHPQTAISTGFPRNLYIFNGVVPESYGIVVAKTGYVTSHEISFTIAGGQQLTVNVTLSASPVPQGTIYGLVTDGTSGALLSGAMVILVSAATGLAVAITETDAAGEVLFCNLPDGDYQLEAQYDGYLRSIPAPVSISGGAFVAVAIALLPVPVPQATVNGVITNTGGSPIPNACVGLYSVATDGLETLLQVTFTDTGGRYLFNRVGSGTYVVKSKAEQTVSVIPGTPSG